MEKYKLLGFKILSGEYQGVPWSHHECLLQYLEPNELKNVTGIYAGIFNFNSKNIAEICGGSSLDSFVGKEIEISWSRYRDKHNRPVIAGIHLIK